MMKVMGDDDRNTMPVGAIGEQGQQHRRGERQGLETSPEEMKAFLGGARCQALKFERWVGRDES